METESERRGCRWANESHRVRTKAFNPIQCAAAHRATKLMGGQLAHDIAFGLAVTCGSSPSGEIIDSKEGSIMIDGTLQIEPLVLGCKGHGNGLERH